MSQTLIEYSVTVYLKSDKILCQDPVLTVQDTVNNFHKTITEHFKESNTSGCIQIVRNGNAIVVPVLSIDYVEFITNEVEVNNSETAS